MNDYQTIRRNYTPMNTFGTQNKSTKSCREKQLPIQKNNCLSYIPYLYLYNSQQYFLSDGQTKKHNAFDSKKYTSYILNYQPMTKSNRRQSLNSYFELTKNKTNSSWHRVISRIVNFIFKRVFSPFLNPL